MAAEVMPQLCQPMAGWAGETAQHGDLQKTWCLSLSEKNAASWRPTYAAGRIHS